jgi:hypothetical protein
MRSLYLLSLLLLVSACGARKSSSYKMGQTTRSEVVAAKGEEPIEVVDLPMPDSSMMKFKDHDSFQLKGDVVVNRFSNPTGDEKLVLWWKNRFKDCATTSKALPKDPKAHTPGEIELTCPEEGISVIYTEGSSAVSRVVEFEK